jgi:NAD-dependent DNA ligase
MATEGQRRQNYLYSNSEMLEVFNRNALTRKKALYWLGFLEGALASGKIEVGEPLAIQKEAEAFSNFFGDPDAYDFVQDLNARCFSSNQDIYQSLSDMSAEKQRQLVENQSLTGNDELNRFFGFCAGIICDGVVLEPEAIAMRKRLKESDILSSDQSIAALRSCIMRAFGDNQLSQNELEEIREYIARLVGDGYNDTGISNIGNVAHLEGLIVDHALVQFIERTFCITGPMRFGTRTHVVNMIESAGGRFVSAPTRSTDYVVVAVNASTMWKTTHYGTKIERAREIAAKGAPLSFLCETALERALIETLGTI